MATIGNDKNGRKRILFMAGDGSRKTVRLGKASKAQANAYKVKVEALVTAVITGVMDDEVARWVESRDDKTHARLAAVGLVKPRQMQKVGLGSFIDGYIDGRGDIKPRTIINLKQLRKWMVDFFGESRDVRTIGPGDAEDFRQFMVKGGLGENTIRRKIGRARQVFAYAIRRGLVRGANPFAGMAAAVRSDKSRQFFVTREMADKVIAQCPDNQWKLLVALSRYGGLRCPSEHLALKWSDIDWGKNRIRVPSPKTEHHEGKECRYIPLFPELAGPLLTVFTEGMEPDAGEQRSDWVINRYRDSSTNLRTHLTRLIRKAGFEPWPKLWHNLRATRQTELAERFPIHVVCAWLGNSRAVAQEHYLQVTDAHFEAALGISEGSGKGSDRPSKTSGRGPEKAAQKAAQYQTESEDTEGELVGAGARFQPNFPHDSERLSSVPFDQYPQQDSNL